MYTYYLQAVMLSRQTTVPIAMKFGLGLEDTLIIEEEQRL